MVKMEKLWSLQNTFAKYFFLNTPPKLALVRNKRPILKGLHCSKVQCLARVNLFVHRMFVF